MAYDSPKRLPAEKAMSTLRSKSKPVQEVTACPHVNRPKPPAARPPCPTSIRRCVPQSWKAR
ncbi:hypothetical protein ARTHRO8AJ_80060 [Arthrobacter sp. 8AJ]|nr:hypothetical protein ARTHRO8AJ_80060 [Arthrobacter sp. 8AJ]